MTQGLGYGPGAKLLNLALKQLACLTRLTEPERNRLIGLLHVPLDRHTIGALRRVAPDLCIPANARMTFIENNEQYDRFQTRIRDIARKAGVVPIWYEILAYPDKGKDSKSACA